MENIYQDKKIEDLKVGEYSVFQKTVSDSDVMMFCGETGDLGPLYQDVCYAGNSSFGTSVVPPMLLASMTGAAVYRLLKPNAYPIKREFETMKSVQVGDTVIARAEIMELIKELQQVVLLLEVYDSNHDLVMTGKSVEQLIGRKGGDK